MTGSLEDILYRYQRPWLTDVDISILYTCTPDSRYGQVKRLLDQGKLIHIRRGLYCLGEKMGHVIKPHPFELAQYIYGPSYISLESALSFHGLIPEAVYEITSTCIKRAKTFQTPLGVFSYTHLPSENFYLDVEIVTESNAQFFIAKPWKAICDYVFCYKKNWKGLAPLFESLRIDQDELPILSDIDMERLDAYYQNLRIRHFLKWVGREQNRD